MSVADETRMCPGGAMAANGMQGSAGICGAYWRDPLMIFYWTT